MLLEHPRAHELVGERQMRALEPPLLGADDVLPAAVRQEPMIAARHQLRPVLECHAVCRLSHHPVVEDLSEHIPAIGATTLGAIDPVAGPEMTDRQRPTVAHEDFCIARYTINTSMATSPIWIDRPLERDVRPGGHAIQGALAPDLMESGVERLRSVESADHRGASQAGQSALLIHLD
jgi:hypothetical protein